MLSAPDFTVVQYLAIAAVALVGGLVRGFSGFGSALVVVPALSILVGPQVAVPAVAMALLVTTLQLVPSTWPHVRWRLHWALSAAGCLGVPLGVLLLIWMDPDLLRRAISAVTAASALLLMTGWRYTGGHSLSAAAAIGSIGGFLSGAASIGGPPVVAYLLAGQGSPAEFRANVVYYFAVTQVTGLVLYGFSGLLTSDSLVAALLITPVLVLGAWIGSRLFGLANEKIFRRVALSVLLAIGLVTLAL